MNVNFVTALAPKGKFLDMETYCGEAFHGASVHCDGLLDMRAKSEGFRYSHGQCEAEKDREKRSFTIDFDNAQMAAHQRQRLTFFARTIVAWTFIFRKMSKIYSLLFVSL